MSTRSVAQGHVLAFWLLILVSALCVHRPVAAQSRPSQEQLEILRSLSPDQQRAVIEAMSSKTGGAQRVEPPLTEPRISMPTELDEAAKVERERGSRIAPGSVLLISVAKPEEDVTDSEEQRAILLNRRDRILHANPYRIDQQGRLTLPVLPNISLAGLSPEEAAQRLTADPRLRGLVFEVALLPIEPSGSEALRPFGYDLFREVPTTFAPATDIPVPPDYVLGPGDNVLLDLFGKRSDRYSLVVDREGRIVLPDIGPVSVASRSFETVRADIEARIAEQMIGVRAAVSLGPLRSIRIFVLGDVVRPGSYTVSGLSTVTHALFTSGGVTPVGSLRNIELKRRGSTIARLDFYDLLLRGDTSGDRRLQSGDVVFVPPVGTTAGISGNVSRPAIYELKADATMADLLELSGGLLPDADPRFGKLDRIDTDRIRTVIDLDLTTAGAKSMRLRAGDIVTVPRVLDIVERSIELRGAVQRPGTYAWRDGMRLTDLLGSLDALKGDADQRYVLIRREHLPDRRIEVLSADAAAAFAARGSERDLVLQSRDRVIVFSLNADRGSALSELLEELRMKTRDNAALPIVGIGGRVRARGQYPLEPGMKVSDLLRAGGGLDEAAYRLEAELTRLVVDPNAGRTTKVIQLSLEEILNGVNGADIALQPYDSVVIKETPDWEEQGTVRVLGEVRFPGTYPIRRGETMSSVIVRAGGLTGLAFEEGAILTREEIKAQERKQIEMLATRLQSDLTLLAVQSSQGPDRQGQSASEALAAGQALLAQLRTAEPTGRLVIDLSEALAKPKSDHDIQLRTGDTLIVPPARQYVTVVGEVHNPTSHVWRSDLSRSDYLSLSGGTTEKANSKRIYVVRADGSVQARANGWLRSGNAEMRPGDTIVVPLQADKMRPLPLWSAVTQIIYNLAIAAAAVNSF